MFTAQDVKELREKTGVGMMDCKRALTEANGDMDEAIKILREKGLAAAAKKASRIAAEGIVESYIHLGGKIGVLLEVNCETDFVAKTPEFKSFVHSIAMHIAATAPVALNIEGVPAEAVAHEKSIFAEQAAASGKPANIIEKMVEGRIRKFYEEVVLEEQAYIMDPDKKVKAVIADAAKDAGAEIKLVDYAFFKLGDGLQKKEEDFAAEVAAQLKK